MASTQRLSAKRPWRDYTTLVVLSFVALGAFALSARAVSGTTSYSYDVHGRLTTVIIPNATDFNRVDITHDNANNRTQLTTSFTDLTPPPVPTSLSASAVASDRINLAWSTTSTPPDFANYRIYRGGSPVSTSTTVSFSDFPLTPNTPYNYRVSARDTSGNESALSNQASATTPPGADTTPPSVPTGLAGIPVSGTWINLSWNASTDTGGSGLAGYELFRNNGVNPLATVTTLTYADQGLTPATTYLYTVRAYDGGGNRSALSGQIAVTTPDTLAPSPPGTPTFSSITSSSATASWGAANDNVAVTGYRYRLNSSGWTEIGNVTSASLGGLSSYTGYTMDVQARDAVGNWSSSSSASFSTLDGTAPTAPGAPTFSAITNNSATATWTSASDNVGVTVYEYKFSTSSTWTSAGTALAVNLTGLALNTSYTLEVRAGDAAGNRGPIASNSFTTSAFHYDNATFTGGIGGDFITYNVLGYISGLGSLVPNSLSGGQFISQFYNYIDLTTGWNQVTFTVWGFAADPGAGWLQSVTVPSANIDLTGASATYVYFNNSGNWIWTYGGGNFSGAGTMTTIHQ